MSRPETSITEIPNSLTEDIDMASPVGIVRLFRQTDSQIFNGWKDFEGICDKEIVSRLCTAVEECAKVLSFGGKKKVIIAGAGTSGRLAMVIARDFNRLALQLGQKPCFDYIIAGGDLALIKAQEGAEDDPLTAQKELKSCVGDAEKVFYVGVTCGCSAPYIAGQLDYASRDDKYFSVLIGFNPPELARKIKIENWDKTFFDVMNAISDNPRCALVNPVLGPEPITGSTRMKGGSATKLLLEVLFTAAFIRGKLLSPNTLARSLKSSAWDLKNLVFSMLRQYEYTRISTYRQRDDIAHLVELAGRSLRAGRHIYYIGENSYGVLGAVDASECPPTFGAAFEDVRGYLPGGWPELLDRDQDYSDEGSEYQISLEDFKRDKLPHLTPDDVVIILGREGTINDHEALLEKIKAMEARLCAVLINPIYNSFPGFDGVVRLRIDPTGLTQGHPVLAEMSVKLVINAITTGAHILAGKIYQNRMIDLNISNNKLFYRTIDILQALVGVDRDTAFLSVLKSIYQTDEPTVEQLNAPISEHINNGTWKNKIVPRALLISTGKFNLQQAKDALKKEPVVRAIIEKIAKN